MIPRILFVDDQPEILDGLRRILRRKRDDWEIQYCTNAREAITIIDQSRVDVMITDMRMPGLDGAQLCNEVMVRSPLTIRMILSGQSDDEQFIRTIGSTHRYLSKPCAPETLIQAIEHAVSMHDLIQDPPLHAFVSQFTTLPSMPEVFTELLTEFQSTDPDMNRIVDLVARDIAISSRVLHLVNSAYFGLRCRVDSPAHAAKLLGLERLKGLVLTAGLFSQLDSNLSSVVGLDALQELSLSSSVVASGIMRKEVPGSLELANKTVVAGVVHDIGQLLLLQSRPDAYGRIIAATRHCPEQLCAAELKSFGVTHAAVGAHLLSVWGMDEEVVDAVAYHHVPCESASETFTVLTALHVSEALIQELDTTSQWPFGAVLNTEYLASRGMLERLDEWRVLTKACLGRRQT